jgi:hypothetical protein
VARQSAIRTLSQKEGGGEGRTVNSGKNRKDEIKLPPKKYSYAPSLLTKFDIEVRVTIKEKD